MFVPLCCMPCLPQQFCENISKNVQQAESAAAAMQAVAHAHAYQHAAVQAALGINAAADRNSDTTTSGSSGSTGVVEHNTAPFRSSSSSSSSSGPLPLGLPRQLLVAGQAVPAAEQAHSAPVALPRGISPFAPTTGSSGGGGGIGAAVRVQDELVLSSWAAAALSGNESGSSAASMGSREYDPAPESDAGDSSDPGMYWPSSVGSGAVAGDSEDF
jgi:hypothetical protein